jgi:uncharacterized membrane protein
MAFVNNILAGHAVGIVAGLVPSALLGEICKALRGQLPVFGTIYQLVTAYMLAVPLLIGAACAMKFRMKPIPTVCVAATSFIGSGALVFTPDGITINGMGDLVNTLVTVSLTCGLILLIGDRMRSFEPLLMPIIVCVIGGGMGVAVYPFVHTITIGLGDLVNSFFALQPIPMAILVAISFSLILISPVSTVAIATAISMGGLASGAGNLGCVAAAVGMFIGGLRVNPIGLSLSALLGTPKIMIGAMVRNPKISVPIMLNAAALGIFGALFEIKGTAISAGFGFSGLVGPINAVQFMDGGATAANLLILFLIYGIIAFAGGFFFEWFCRRILHLYKAEDYRADA